MAGNKIARWWRHVTRDRVAEALILHEANEAAIRNLLGPAGSEPCECTVTEGVTARGSRLVVVFCPDHCPDCANPLLAPCRYHISADELGELIVEGAGRHRRAL